MRKLGPTLHDLHAEIGMTLLIWGWLEGEMIGAKINWRHTAPVVATEPLRSFLTDLAEPRGIRNAIAHGLASAHSDPSAPEFEPYITCRTRDAGLRKITLGDLRRNRRSLSAFAMYCGLSTRPPNLDEYSKAASRPLLAVQAFGSICQKRPVG